MNTKMDINKKMNMDIKIDIKSEKDENIFSKKDTIPWVEKYRPTSFENIVLDVWNRKILENIIIMKRFPNILFYGPPGTGKTTTIINLIKEYQNHNNEYGKDLIIHLNASDDRGIDIIRNQIQQFVSSKSLFGIGTKFVILDEVDYMTKNAQQALKNLMNLYSNVRFCLICNYISRIERCLQDECINMRFNQLPEKDIIMFLENIVKNEKLNYTNEELNYLQKYYNSDIRSMINFMQTNQNNNYNYKLFDYTTLKNIFIKVVNITDKNELIIFVNSLSIEYNINRKQILLKLIYFLIKEYKLIDINNHIIDNISVDEKSSLIESFMFIIHNENIYEVDYLICYFWYKLKESFSSSISK